MVILSFRQAPKVQTNPTPELSEVDRTLRFIARYIHKRWSEAAEFMQNDYSDQRESGPYLAVVARETDLDLSSLIESALRDKSSESKILGTVPSPGFSVRVDIQEGLDVKLKYCNGRSLLTSRLNPSLVATTYNITVEEAEALVNYSKIIPSLIALSSDPDYQRNLRKGIFPFAVIRSTDETLETMATEFLVHQNVLRSLSSTFGMPIIITLTKHQYERVLKVSDEFLPRTYRLFEQAEFKCNLND